MIQRGTYISGAGHAGFILWALFGGFFLSARDTIPVQSSDVSLISSEQFAALIAPDTAPDAAQETDQPRPPVISDVEPDLPPVTEDTAPPVIVEPAPAVTNSRPEAPPKPEAAPRVAPIAAPEPPENTEISETVTPEIQAEPDGEATAEEEPAAAPQQAATEIVTEAEQPASAPQSSPRPTSRPTPPVSTPETEPEIDPVAQAVAEAVASETPDPTPVAPTGPPLSQGQIEGFRVAVGNCWNVDNGSAAARVTVTIGFGLDRQGKVKGSSITFIDASAGEQSAVNAAYEAARRAIIRCGIKGYDLPLEKYDRWKDIEMTFNPEGMRIK